MSVIRNHSKGSAPGITTQEVEITAAKHFDLRANVIVPNVSWGIGLPYEADLVVLRPSGWAIEVEIKVSASDIKADLKKGHTHNSNRFKELWFAVPESLECHPSLPTRAGVLSVRRRYNADGSWQLCAAPISTPSTNPNAGKWTDKERMKLYELGLMRIWQLKEKVI